MSCAGLVSSKAGQQQEVRDKPAVEQRSEPAVLRTSTGEVKSTIEAEQEHNQSITGKALPPDLLTVVEAWDALPPALRDGIVAMVKVSIKAE